MDTTTNKVVVVEGSKDCKYDPFAQLANQHTLNAVQMTDKDVKDSEANIRYGVKDSEAEIRYAVKDAEADIRHDVLFEGQENQKTSLEVEARLKDRLTIDRNAWDAQFMSLHDKMCDAEKETIKQGYEGRLETIRNTEKLNEKINHLSERLGDKIEVKFDILKSKIDSCCCDGELANATQAGLLSQIVHAVVK